MTDALTLLVLHAGTDGLPATGKDDDMDIYLGRIGPDEIVMTTIHETNRGTRRTTKYPLTAEQANRLAYRLMSYAAGDCRETELVIET